MNGLELRRCRTSTSHSVSNASDGHRANRPHILIDYATAWRHVVAWSATLPDDIVGVCGVPRSGTIIAAMLAQHRNIPLVEWSSLVGRQSTWKQPLRRHWGVARMPPHGAVLVVDDTSFSGSTLRNNVKPKLRQRRDVPFLYGALYVGEAGRSEVDHWFATMPHIGHTFAWNLFHDMHTTTLAVDLDGVLCPNRPCGEGGRGRADDWQRLLDLPCLNRPSRKLAAIITERRETLRFVTEAWLTRHSIETERLIMRPSEQRPRWLWSRGNSRPAVARWKAAQYAKLDGATLFVESDPVQARIIGERTGQSVLAWPDWQSFFCGQPCLKGAVS